MRRGQLIILYVSILGVTIYLIYVNLSARTGAYEGKDFFQFKIEEKVVPFNFCGEVVPLNDPVVKKKLEAEVNILFTYHHSTEKVIKRAKFWLPQMSAILASQNIPDDFKYLAVIESNLSNVVSPRGAAGFWQFMRVTGRKMGLEINNEVDERYDPIRSTNAAARYFKFGYKELNNWTNVAASYNMGIAGMQRRIKRQNEKSYFKLKLNRETARYVYKALAYKEIFENQEKYGFDKVEASNEIPRHKILMVKKHIPDLIEFSDSLEVKYPEIVNLNPWIKSNRLTIKSSGKFYYLKIPY